ncbi:MAG: response regulator transcription factor [Saprospiraceae bacterium]|nr:response regulator transcription factor [Saprospiraceae bacterium]
MSPIRVLLFEDNKNFAETLSDYFEDSKQVFITEVFHNAEKAVPQIKEYKPDVVLMDIEMPGISGLDAMSKINDANTDTKVMIQTQFEDSHRIFVALSRGALGYALKTDSLKKIEAAIVDVHNGGGYFSPAVANKVATFFRHKEVQASSEYVKLTETELKVLNYMESEPGWTYENIAQEMNIGYYTVHSHTRNIYRKLHVNCRGEAIQKAIQLRLIP